MISAAPAGPVRRPARCRCRRSSGRGRSGRWSRASVRAAPRRPGATAGRCPTVADRSGQNPRPGPSRASITSSTPKPSAPSAIAGPASTRRRTRRGGEPRRVALSRPGCSAAKLLVGGQHHPQAGVDRRRPAPPRAAEQEPRPHPQDRYPRCADSPDGDAADHPGLGVAGRAAEGTARGGTAGASRCRTVGSCSSGVHRHAGTRGAGHAATSLAPPTAGRPCGAGRGGPRGIPDGPGRATRRA